jgi:hypothetical protein
MVSFAWVEHLLETAPIPLHREERVPVCLPVVVTGYGASAFFQTRTFTVDVSQGGCCIYLPQEATPGNLIFLSLAARDGSEIAPESRGLYQIAWAHPDGSGWVVGAKRVP